MDSSLHSGGNNRISLVKGWCKTGIVLDIVALSFLDLRCRLIDGVVPSQLELHKITAHAAHSNYGVEPLLHNHFAETPMLELHHNFAEDTEELERLFEASRNQTYQRPPGLDSIYKHAHFNIKMRWIEQGSWKHEWNDQSRPSGHWKHEEPLQPESETGSDSIPPLGLFGAEVQRKPPKQPAKSDEEIQREQLEREASRPYYQFVYQVSKERERILEEMNPPKPRRQNPMTQAWVGLDGFHAEMEAYERWRREGSPDDEPATPTPPDINTTAYERVKSAWIKRRIWDTKWGVLPGMSWKHEQPFEEMLREELGDDPGSEGAGGVDGNRPETAEQPGGELFGSVVQGGGPFGAFAQQEDASGEPTHDAAEANGDRPRGSHPHLSQPDPHGESSQRPGARGLDDSVQQSSSAKSPPFAAGEAGSLPGASDPRDDAPESSQRASPAVRRTQPRRRTAQSIQPEPLNVGPAALRLVRSTRVSKTRKPSRPARSGPQEEPAEANLPADARPSMTEPDVDEPGQVLPETVPRRSRRLQASSEDKKPARSNGLPDKRNAIRRSARLTSGGATKTAAAKPEGVTKRGSRRSRRRKAG
jgi:hypothetical protein